MPEPATHYLDLRGAAIRRVGLLSDTHGWIDPRILQAITDCDLVIHAGDVCGTAVLEAIAERQPRLVAIAGNNDRAGSYVTDSGAMLELHEMVEIELEDGLIAVEHGHRHDWRKPSHEALRQAHPQARLVVYGHTHELVCDLEHSPWVVNPGAAGQVRTRGGPSWIKLDLGDRDWRLQPQRWREAA